MSDLSTVPQAPPARGAGPVVLTLAGLLAAFGVASCCGLPLLLATLGLGTAWPGGFALLAAPHRVFLLTAAAVCLVGAAVLLWQQRSPIACAPGAICARPTISRFTAIGLLIWFVLLYLGYAYA
jgi:mercuric ion transport protein